MYPHDVSVVIARPSGLPVAPAPIQGGRGQGLHLPEEAGRRVETAAPCGVRGMPLLGWCPTRSSSMNCRNTSPPRRRQPGPPRWLPRPSGLAATWHLGLPGEGPREWESAVWQRPDPELREQSDQPGRVLGTVHQQTSRPRADPVQQQEASHRLPYRGERRQLRVRGWGSARGARVGPGAWSPEAGVAAREQAPSTDTAVGAGAGCHGRRPRRMRSPSYGASWRGDIRRSAHPPAAWEDGQKCPLSGARPQPRPVRSSQAVAAARVETPSLEKMLPRWWATVRSLRTNSSAIWRFVLPRATSRSTSASRSVRPPASLRRERPPPEPTPDPGAHPLTPASATAPSAQVNAPSN